MNIFTYCAAPLETWFDQSPFHERVSLFATQFRSQLPELYCLHIIRLLMQSEWVNRSSHFEEEELDIKECVTSWFKFLLARELPLPCLLRLWDTYLANGLDLHFYVCLGKSLMAWALILSPCLSVSLLVCWFVWVSYIAPM